MLKFIGNYINNKEISNIIFDFLLMAVLFIISIEFIYSAFLNEESNKVTTSLLLSAGILVINIGFGFYKKINKKTRREIKVQGLLALSLSLLFGYVILSYSAISMRDDRAFALTLVASVSIILINRLYAIYPLKNGFLRKRILVYGSSNQALSIGKTITKSNPNIDLIGYYTGLNEIENHGVNCNFLTSEKTLTEHVREQQIDEIVVALNERRGGSMPLRELLDCKLSGIRVVDMASHIENRMGKISRDYVSVGNLIFSDGFKQGVVRKSAKRLFDIIFSIILLVLTMPILLLSCLLILVESGRPILYFQERVGLNGKLFNIYKLRSMNVNAEEKDKPVWALLTDDRITRVGKTIRKYRIDELPQLFSILTGKMSLVGPRPERNFFVKKLIQDLPFYEVRQSVKPGLTGWAQVRYHYGSTVEDASEKLQYDLYYVKNNSLWLDFNILFKTIGVVITGRGSR